MEPKRWLITGASGFIGTHFLRRLQSSQDKVFALVLPKTPALAGKVERIEGNLQNLSDVSKAVRRAAPTHVLHLAGMAAPAACEILRRQAWSVNVDGTFQLLEALEKYAPSARCLLLSSAFVYRPSKSAFHEQDPLQPGTFYGWTKLAGEQLGHYYADRGQPIFIARPFNLIGPGQSDLFLAPAVAKQIALAETGKVLPQIRVGKLGVSRDFLDARDAVNAFLAILEKGKPGETYNVCSGKGLKVSDLVSRLAAKARIPLEIVVEGRRAKRPDHPRLVGSSAKLRRDCGWRQEISLSDSLDALLAEWRREMQGGNAVVKTDSPDTIQATS